MRGHIGGRAAAVAALTLVLAVSAMAGPKWDLGDDSWMQLSFLGQVHYSYIDASENETDFYLRRGRFILAGQIMEGVKFFVETDNDNAGRNGAVPQTDIQDAFLDMQVGDSGHWLQAGLILLPFSFETHSSAANLLGIDYNAETVKFVNTHVWRDYGVSARGALGGRFAYNVGIFDGYGAADEGSVRITGHLAFNLLGKAEASWFDTQNRLGEGNYLAVGAGLDTQDNATIDDSGETPVKEDNSAWVVDVQSAFDIKPVRVILNGAYCDWDNGTFKGATAFVEGGVLYGKGMLTAKYSLADPDSGDSTSDYTAGLHYFLKGHNARAGFEYRFGDSDDLALVGLQFLL